MSKFTRTMRYGARQKHLWWILPLAVLISLLAACVFDVLHWMDWNFWEPMLTVGTLIAALLIGYLELSQETEEKAPKRLTICFLYPPDAAGGYEGDIALLCHDAYLSGESDIRALAQNVGGQMAEGNLNFSPCIKQLPSEIDWAKSEPVKSYQVVFTLRDCNEPRAGVPLRRLSGKPRKTIVWRPSDPDVSVALAPKEEELLQLSYNAKTGRMKVEKSPRAKSP